MIGKRPKTFSQKEEGLTLIELLIVVGILGVLASIVIGNVTGVQGRGKNQSFIEDEQTIQKAVDTYYTGTATINKYPTCNGTVSSSFTSPSGSGVYIDFYYLVSQEILRSAASSAGSLNNVSSSTAAGTCTSPSSAGTGNYNWWVDNKGKVHSTNTDGTVDRFNGKYP